MLVLYYHITLRYQYNTVSQSESYNTLDNIVITLVSSRVISYVTLGRQRYDIIAIKIYQYVKRYLIVKLVLQDSACRSY